MSATITPSTPLASRAFGRLAGRLPFESRLVICIHRRLRSLPISLTCCPTLSTSSIPRPRPWRRVQDEECKIRVRGRLLSAKDDGERHTSVTPDVKPTIPLLRSGLFLKRTRTSSPIALTVGGICHRCGRQREFDLNLTPIGCSAWPLPAIAVTGSSSPRRKTGHCRCSRSERSRRRRS